MATCSDCACWQQIAEGSDLGRCRFYPPQVYSGGFSMWPQTRSGSWCRQHTEISIEMAVSAPVYTDAYSAKDDVATADGDSAPPQLSTLDKLKAWLRQ